MSVLILVVDGELLFGKRRMDPRAAAIVDAPAPDPG